MSEIHSKKSEWIFTVAGIDPNNLMKKIVRRGSTRVNNELMLAMLKMSLCQPKKMQKKKRWGRKKNAKEKKRRKEKKTPKKKKDAKEKKEKKTWKINDGPKRVSLLWLLDQYRT